LVIDGTLEEGALHIFIFPSENELRKAKSVIKASGPKLTLILFCASELIA